MTLRAPEFMRSVKENMQYLIILLIILIPSIVGFFFRILSEEKSDSLISLIIGISLFILLTIPNSHQAELKTALDSIFDLAFLTYTIYFIVAWCNIGIVAVLSLPGVKLANKLIKNKN